ncbi:putative RNA-directed DNA polymerase [Tanacetum coccineum]
MAEEGKIKIDKFDGHDFGFWKMQIEDYPQALGVVRISLAKNIAYNVVKEKTKYDLIKALSSIRQRQGQKARQRAKAEQRDYDDELICCVKNMIEDRIMDFGALFHATFCKEELERFRLRTSKDVRYIPGLKRRLIFVEQLDEEGYHVGFGDQKWKITKGSLVVARGNKRRSMYMVEIPSDGINATIDGRGNATLWHQRLRHMSEKGMKIVASKGWILDIQKAIVGFCEPCVLSKQKKVSFIKLWNTRKLQRLELVHTDVYDPKSVASIGGSRYYVTFIDDYSRKCLTSNNGGEYSSREFIEYYAENEIRMLKTVPETPQQNGVAERMNRTLNERVKSMRLHAGHPKIGMAREGNLSRTLKGIWAMDQMRWDITFGMKGHKVVRSRDVTFNEDSLYGAKAAIDSSNLTKPNQKGQVVLKDGLDNLVNNSFVVEHGLSSEIT